MQGATRRAMFDISLREEVRNEEIQQRNEVADVSKFWIQKLKKYVCSTFKILAKFCKIFEEAISLVLNFMWSNLVWNLDW